MANRTTYPVNTPRSEAQIVTAKLVGAGAADMTIPEGNNSEIVSCTRSATGVFALVFRHAYPELKSILGLNFGPRGTDGLKASFSAIDMAAKTATLQIEVNTTDTDPATTDTLHIALFVRNSGRNR